MKDMLEESHWCTKRCTDKHAMNILLTSTNSSLCFVNILKMPQRRRGVCQSYGEKLLIQITKIPEEFKKITKNYSSDLFKLKERMNQLERTAKEEIGVKEKEFQEIISFFCNEKKKQLKQLNFFHKSVVTSISKKMTEVEKKAGLKVKEMKEIYADELK